MHGPIVSLMEQKDREEKWAMAKLILPEIRRTFQEIRHIDYDQKKVEWFLDVIRNYLPRVVAQDKEFTEAEQTEILGTITSFNRALPRFMNPRRMRQALALFNAVTEKQKRLLDFFGVKDGSTRPSKD